MVEAIQRVIQGVCLSSLALMGAALAALGVSAMIRRMFARIRSIGVAVLLSLAVVSSVMFGGAKTNGLLQSIFPFAPHIQLTPFAPGTVPQGFDPPLAAPSPRASADMPFRAANWNKRGAWNDSFRCAFPDDWVFPYGTGHIDRVEVCSQGRVITRYGSSNVVASVGVPMEIVNPITSFGCGATDRNSYIFVWTNAVVGRLPQEGAANAETMDASIELFRNGDVAVTTNGVTELTPRVLPFPHDGYGQDDEWVAANFTNATEILAMGYPQWVDAQVGENLTNGLYKFTVTVPDVPPETVQLVVGDYSIAVTNTGDYVFLLEKGALHQIQLSCFLDDVQYSCDDGLSPPDAPLRQGPIGSPQYTVVIASIGDNGNGVELVAPTRNGAGHVLCWPCLSIAPSMVADPVFPVLLHADVMDIPVDAIPTVTWKLGDDVLETGESYMLTGEESLGADTIDVTAVYRDVTLHGAVAIERHVRESEIAFGGGGLMVVEDAYTNAPDDVVAASCTTTGLHLAWSLAEAGQLKLETDCGSSVAVFEDLGDGIELPVSLDLNWNADRDDEGTRDFLVYCTDPSRTGMIGTFTFSFTPEDGGTVLTNTMPLQIVKFRVEADADWPSNKVRHVFGPKERFQVISTPQAKLSVAAESYVIITNVTTVIAPDRAGPFSVTASFGTVTKELLFDCIAPTTLIGGNPRVLDDYEFVQHEIPQFSVGEAGVAMHIDTWLEPLFVSFQNVCIYEGVAALMISTNMYYNGSYQLSIPLYWFAKNGFVTNRLPDNVQTMSVYSNGTMRVNKNGVTWERRLDGTSCKVEE